LTILTKLFDLRREACPPDTMAVIIDTRVDRCAVVHPRFMLPPTSVVRLAKASLEHLASHVSAVQILASSLGVVEDLLGTTA
jgi:hypothetical protein